MLERRNGNQTVRLCFLVSSLEFGGAERQVVELVRSFNTARVKAVICSLSKEVPLAVSLPKTQEWLHIVERHARFDFTTIFRVAKLLRRERIDVVHAFLFDAEIVARLAAPLARVPVVIASERNTDYSRPRLHRALLRLTQPLFDVMIANSFAGKRFNMRSLGLPESRIEVVHNGVNTERFRPDREAGMRFRECHGIPVHASIIGMVGSFKRQKGHELFLRMAAMLRQRCPDAFFLIVGGVLRDDWEASRAYQAEMKDLAASLGLTDRCLFLENQQEMTALYNACDLTVLLSTREGTPNVVLESMACGVPVIATNVADNAAVVLDGETGFLVGPNEPEAAVSHAERIIKNNEARSRMGEAARRHVSHAYSLKVATDKLEAIYRTRLSAKHRRIPNLDGAQELA